MVGGCSAARSSANEHNSFANSNETLFRRIFNDHLEFILGAESLLPRSLSFWVAVACPTALAFKLATALRKEYNKGGFDIIFNIFCDFLIVKIALGTKM